MTPQGMMFDVLKVGAQSGEKVEYGRTMMAMSLMDMAVGERYTVDQQSYIFSSMDRLVRLLL